MLRHERRLCCRSILAVCTCKLESSIEVYLHWYHSAFRLLIITLFVRKSGDTLSLVNLSLTLSLVNLSLTLSLVNLSLTLLLVTNTLTHTSKGMSFWTHPLRQGMTVWHKTKTEQRRCGTRQRQSKRLAGFGRFRDKTRRRRHKLTIPLRLK